ncbi:glycosyltransferase [Chitinophaga sp. 30R24]|uniref:glycosyltransferase n=1 Tax=Chitinophaga sp. 30R24 TaxID=3248838 RepID=UPI003B9147F4
MSYRKKITFLTIGDISQIATMKRALGMANPLHKLGWDVSIIAMECEENRTRIALECDPAIHIEYYKACSFMEEPAVKTALVNKINPDFVYFCSFSIRNRLLKSKLMKKPKLLIEHAELQSAIKSVPLKRRIWFYLLEIYSILYADGLLCASKYLDKHFKQLAKKMFKRIPVLYSPYAFNNDIISSYKLIEDQLIERYQGRKLLLYMGTMTQNYGLFAMLEAMKALSATNPELLLLLMGRGRHLEEAKQYVAAHRLENYVVFLGYIPEIELSSYFSVAKYFISPLNNTVQDKARCPSKIYMYLPFDKPILTSAIGEPQEIFKENGYYFETEKPQTLVDLIQHLENTPLTREVYPVKEQHSWEKRALDFNYWVTKCFSAKDMKNTFRYEEIHYE